ncbi:hypothetical protein VTJ04DRAFT_372 [Mycothermus thermophilus]|uniref:uncharacterized protein n=1 Tax=Humicola insolens TaxID=85995 RepID=UPI0037441816
MAQLVCPIWHYIAQVEPLAQLGSGSHHHHDQSLLYCPAYHPSVCPTSVPSPLKLKVVIIVQCFCVFPSERIGRDPIIESRVWVWFDHSQPDPTRSIYKPTGQDWMGDSPPFIIMTGWLSEQKSVRNHFSPCFPTTEPTNQPTNKPPLIKPQEQ